MVGIRKPFQDIVHSSFEFGYNPYTKGAQRCDRNSASFFSENESFYSLGQGGWNQVYQMSNVPLEVRSVHNGIDSTVS